MAPLAWLVDANVVSEMMRPRPMPQVADFIESIAHKGSESHRSLFGRCSTA